MAGSAFFDTPLVVVVYSQKILDNIKRIFLVYIYMYIYMYYMCVYVCMYIYVLYIYIYILYK